MKTTEIPNLSRWVKPVHSRFMHQRREGIPESAKIRLVKTQRNGLEYRYSDEFYDGSSSDFKTLSQAKKCAGDEVVKYGNWTHGYHCPECDVELKFVETDYADFDCENCQKSFTRFGEQSSKH